MNNGGDRGRRNYGRNRNYPPGPGGAGGAFGPASQKSWKDGSFNQMGGSHNSERPQSANSNFRQNRGRGQYNNRNGPRDNGNREPRPMGFKFLEEILTKDEDEFIFCIMNDRKGFAYLCEKAQMTNDMIILVVKVLKRVCELNFDETKCRILSSSLNEKFLGVLKNFIACLPLQNKNDKLKNRYFWNDPDNFWNNLIAISNYLLNSTPTIARVVLEDVLKPLRLCLPNFEEVFNMHVNDEVKTEVNRLNKVLDDLMEQHEMKRQKIDMNLIPDDEDNEEPPDDFRQLSIYPTSIEIVGNYHSFLRKNVVVGAYRDANHYLDVQFRLLREDFVGPLREGVGNYLSNSQRRLENIKIYNNVRFLNTETVNEYHSYRIQWDSAVNNKRKMNFENSKRFMFGALLCFTTDQKFSNLFFGKVVDRKLDDLKKGELVVGFNDNPPIDYKRAYLMVECSIYFEPYYHVLSVLQRMSIENFPMERYLIKVESTVRSPTFLRPDSVYLIEENHFRPTEIFRSKFFTLNDSQLVAFRAAMTQEFTLIQGPPGTGKTFLGLKIAETLLKNINLWHKQTPMLVICFTNHALDQFLEGLIPTTTQIVRVGGQSKNPKMAEFNLMNVRRKVNVDRQAVHLKRMEIKRLLSEIQATVASVKTIEDYVGVVEFTAFNDVVPHFSETWFASANNQQIIHWLFGGREFSRVEEVYVDEAEETTTEAIQEKDNADNDLVDAVEETEDQNFAFKYDDLFDDTDDPDVAKVGNCRFLISLSELSKTINYHTQDVRELCEENNLRTVMIRHQLQQTIRNNRANLTYLKMCLDQGRRLGSNMRFVQKPDLRKPDYMCPNDRWCLYFKWLALYKVKLRDKLTSLDRNFREVYKVYDELRSVEDVAVMKTAHVIGMTTTCAARLRSTLSTLKSPIVIVEEAAEVLEAHIITALTPNCKQLILIGDHQQLKPNTSDYRVETKYKLGISLFERMVINNIQCHTLNVQHRMRPEIASLIRPAIYPNLQNHSSVENRPAILGVDKCLYFIDHREEEQVCEGASKKNLHEAKFLIHFARHLLLNGYKSEEITILAAYLGQMYELQKERRYFGSLLDGVRISVLDNYQGEESDIILLSLVRNNKDKKVGFLRIDNRVCVALSRARNGMYIMGNMEDLCNASDLWVKVRASLAELNSLGPELSLRCQVHDEVTQVKSADDFLAIPEGGCNRKCEAALLCGHVCTSFCHVLDRHHTAYRCREICGKPLCTADPAHVCRKMCYEECGPCTYKVERNLKCGHSVALECHIDVEKHDCVALVMTALPCGHEAEKPCFRDADTYKCPHKCETKVEPCGHSCNRLCHVRDDPDHIKYKCHKPCAKFRTGCTLEINTHLCTKFCYEECVPCDIIVKKKRTVCPHMYEVPCNSDVDELKCEKPCKKPLECGHKCPNKCHEPCGNCKEMVLKSIPVCGHQTNIKCSETPQRQNCKGLKCPLKLPCGHDCTNKCKDPCTVLCREKVAFSAVGKCGHAITEIACWMKSTATAINAAEMMKFCRHPCGQKLRCGHECAGSCGECGQGRVHKRCAAACGVPLICEHECPAPCREACRPCGLPCPHFCVHSKCRKTCGEVCTPCKERCPRRCRHRRCPNFCGQSCAVPACDRPCPLRLRKCGHGCVGFCGDPCPPLCRVCDRDELEEIFFGDEDEPDARFVFLSECGHVVESVGMENWLKQDEDSNAIQFKVCPKCKTPLRTTQRYGDHIKRAVGDVVKAKEKSVGTQKQNEVDRRDLINKLTSLMKVSSTCHYSVHLSRCFLKLLHRLQVTRKGRRQAIDKMKLTAVTAKYQIVKHMCEILKETKSSRFTDVNDMLIGQIGSITSVLNRDDDYITEQEAEDVNAELGRLQRFVEYSKIKENSSEFSMKSDDVKLLIAKIDDRYVNGLGRYGGSLDADFKRDLEELMKRLKSSLTLSEAERREIVRVMGLSKGHWFKCENGHVYAIGECGGAMQRSVCPECKAPIGGTNHRLESSNAVATEMDGARYGAFSEMANLENFDLHNFPFN